MTYRYIQKLQLCNPEGIGRTLGGPGQLWLCQNLLHQSRAKSEVQAKAGRAEYRKIRQRSAVQNSKAQRSTAEDSYAGD